MKKILLALFCATMFGSPQISHAFSAESEISTSLMGRKRLNGEDATDRILSKIHTTNKNEIDQASLALQKAQMASVKNFAQVEIADHALAEEQLAPLTARLQISVRDFIAKTAQELRDEKTNQQIVTKLNQLSGKSFDRAFVKSQIMTHEKVITWLKQTRSLLDDVEARNYVDMQIMTAMGHLKIATMLSKQL